MRPEDRRKLDWRIAEAIARHGSRSNCARHLGVSRAFITMVVEGQKKPGPRILADLGLELRVEERLVDLRADEERDQTDVE